MHVNQIARILKQQLDAKKSALFLLIFMYLLQKTRTKFSLVRRKGVLTTEMPFFIDTCAV
jgi:hypothetical protein